MGLSSPLSVSSFLHTAFRLAAGGRAAACHSTPAGGRAAASHSTRTFSSHSSPPPAVAPISRDDLVVLGIETSCDDTAASIVRGNGEILSQVISSQAELLSRYGGVAPKRAEEAHLQVIDQVVQQTLDSANMTGKNLSAVAVTIGPGLSLCLRVGVKKARRVAGLFNLPIIGIHHMEAHALVARLIEKDLQFPFLALLISGGHNLLILARSLGHYVQLGTTIDDAIGEAYDKTARWLGLDIGKGGGPALEELAREGDADSVKFSIPMRQHKDCNFSYAGLKTQVRMAIESRNICIDKSPIFSANSLDRRSRADIAASFQRVAVVHLEDRCERSIEWAMKIEPSIKCLVVSGGVASNQYVRNRLNHLVVKNGLRLVCPPPSLCTDNGHGSGGGGVGKRNGDEEGNKNRFGSRRTSSSPPRTTRSTSCAEKNRSASRRTSSRPPRTRRSTSDVALILLSMPLSEILFFI